MHLRIYGPNHREFGLPLRSSFVPVPVPQLQHFEKSSQIRWRIFIHITLAIVCACFVSVYAYPTKLLAFYCCLSIDKYIYCYALYNIHRDRFCRIESGFKKKHNNNRLYMFYIYAYTCKCVCKCDPSVCVCVWVCSVFNLHQQTNTHRKNKQFSSFDG